MGIPVYNRLLLLAVVLISSLTFTNSASAAQWAQAARAGAVKISPTFSAKTVARLHFKTENQMPEAYRVLSYRNDSFGRRWVKIQLPRRPRALTVWTERKNLSTIWTVNTRLVVNKRGLRATLYKSGKAIWSSRVGIGKPSTPTPSGQFYIRQKLTDFGSGSIYGPVAFGTSAYAPRLTDWPAGGVIGVHGTNQPGLLPGRVSNGCIRVPNWNVIKLSKLMPIGTLVTIK